MRIVLALCLGGLWLASLPAMAAEQGRTLVVRNADAAQEKRIALVIGNGTYKSTTPLANPVNDAADIAARLGKLGFEVILKTNVGLRDMSRAVTQFGQKLTPGSVALFYYAGHGIQARGRNFLVPVDAEIAQESSIRSEAVDVDQVLEQLQPARVSVVVLDACRNNPFEQRFRSAGGGGLAQIDAPKGTLIAYATAPGKVAMDGTGRNGLYTAELLKALNAPDRRIEDVFKQVRGNVASATNDQQVPWESSSLTGDLFLGHAPAAVVATTGAASAPGKPAIAATAMAPPSVQADAAAFELEYWRSVEKAGKPEDYRAYLNKYPTGQFADLARSRLTSAEQATASGTATSATPAAPTTTAVRTPGAGTPETGAGLTGSDAVARNELELASRQLKDGAFQDALNRFRMLAETLPKSHPLYRHAVYGLGLAQAANLKHHEALKTLEAATAAWPAHKLAPVAWRQIALGEKALNHPLRAVQALKTLADRYPDSEEAAWARQQLHDRKNQEGKTARLFQRTR